jgi:hypothetical protein
VDRLRYRFILETRQVYTLRNVILNPVAIPPLLGVNLDAVKLHGEMDMVASGHSGHTALAHGLASFD